MAFAWSDRARPIQRAWVLLATLAVVSSLLIAGAANPSEVLGAPGGNTTQFSVVVSGPVTAGVPFAVTVTAKDSRGRTVNSYAGGATLTGSALDDAPGGAPATPGTLDVWDNGSSSTMLTARKSQAAATITASDVVSGVVATGTATFAVRPSSATDLAFVDGANDFDGQPVDTESKEKITSSLTTGDPVKVIALDTFGNRVGGVSLAMTSSPDTSDPADDLLGTKTGSTNNDLTKLGTTPYGEAAFDSLSITKYGRYQLIATAGSLTATSGTFEIVADLVKCGATCKSTGRSAGANLQITYSSLSGTTFSNVVLTTSFLGAASNVECANPTQAFGELSEVRVQGTGVTSSAPSFKLAMIIPKTTLQALNLTSRAADTYNMCLGATRLDGETGGWMGRQTIGGPLVPLTDPDNDGVYWGFVADCGTAGLDADSPCVSLKTKNAGQVQAELGMNKNEFKELGFASSDLAVIINKPFPWDGKSGLY
jgi:hypothetical protein